MIDRIRSCIICGGRFEAARVHAMACSDHCRREMRLRKKKADYIKARGHLPDRQCCVCSASFKPRTTAITCSEVCAQKNMRTTARKGHEMRYVPAKSRSCVICGSDFCPYGKQKTCSPDCSHERERRMENDRRRLIRVENPILVTCVCCGGRFEAARSDAIYCSPKCEYDFNAELKRGRCRNWRKRNPEKQKASTKRWQENNIERHLVWLREYRRRWFDRNPGYKAETSRAFREKYPEKGRAYSAFRTAAFRLVRLVERYGAQALERGFVEPAPPERVLKGREHTRKWRERNPDKRREYEQRQKQERREALVENQRRSSAREASAVKLVREIQSKGLEALI